MNAATKLILLTLIVILVVVIICCHKKTATEDSDLQNQVNNLKIAIDKNSTTVNNLAKKKWSIDVTGKPEYSYSLDYDSPLVTGTPYTNDLTMFAHHFSGQTNTDYDVEFLLATDSHIPVTCDLVVAEMSPSEATSGVYTTAQSIYSSPVATPDNVGRIDFTVKPTLKDSIWVYSCRGGSTTYPITLRVRQK